MFLVRGSVLAVVSSLLVLAGCGGGGPSTPPPPPPPAVGVSVSPATAIAQAGTTVQFTASVSNSTNQSVNWSVNGVAGGNAQLGTITADGLYTAPATVSDTTDVTIRATAQASSTATSNSTVTTYAAPAIAVRLVNSAGEFFDRATGLKFQPRGNNYVRFAPHMIGPPINQSVLFHSTFGPGLYDSSRVETALSAMEQSGYNIVKAWQDCCGATQGIGNPNGNGLSAAYMANVADFMRRARAHHLYVIIVPDDLPRIGGYQQMIDPVCAQVWPGCWALEYTGSGGIAAGTKFWQDFIRALVAQHAPMDAIFAYQIREEFAYPSAAQALPGIPFPLLPSSGNFTAANGKAYNMGDATARQQCMNDSLVYWTDHNRAAIQQLVPGALVGLGSVTGANPYVPPFTVVAGSTADYIDGHTGPGEGTTLAQDMTGWGKPAGPSAKPVIMGEFSARTQPIPVESDAASALKQWQIDSCQQFGFNGWLLWSWDTTDLDQTVPSAQHWYATSGTGIVNSALAPVNRPDPCGP